MPDYASNRLTLTGPTDDIARFVRECVRVHRDDSPNDPPSLDLDAIVPMPPEILATCNGATDELRALARAATGYDDWYDWRRALWGSKWNVCDFHGCLIGETIYDCFFLSAWTSPQAAIRALAAGYPTLSGVMVACETDEWPLVAAFREGLYVGTEAAFDPQIQALFFGAVPAPHRALPVEALLSIVDDPTLFAATDAAEGVWARARLACEHLGGLIGGDLPRRLAFERAFLDMNALIEAGGHQAVLDSDLVRPSASKEHVEFLLTYDRTRTLIDRMVLKILVACLRDDAIWGEGGSADHRSWIEMEILEDHLEDDEDTLHDWACLAMYRPGAMLDWRSEEALRQSFLAYADHLRRDILDHLRVRAAESGSRLPAVV